MAKLPASLAVACLFIRLGHYSKNEDVCNDNQKWRRNKIRNMASPSSSSLASQFSNETSNDIHFCILTWSLTSIDFMRKISVFAFISQMFCFWLRRIYHMLSCMFFDESQFSVLIFKKSKQTSIWFLDNLRAQWHLYVYQTDSVWKKMENREKPWKYVYILATYNHNVIHFLTHKPHDGV